ncbi:hypothetical protein GCM10012275_36250 [Longimycelium tulufanense]|uniref:Carboxymuconolactone decarboxylase-like domain-containing protein n=1 Tax=Longimycelium tulufanense TaxID=907463 RepID=A0A8J3CG60_9PSEU|nr:carboxymuconolactone decarboxylase family protein [Longimycelium tulufanense]GGM62220.1 hypothetical protein GCM10012275_36250 [Longimycelium tulufanense]
MARISYPDPSHSAELWDAFPDMPRLHILEMLGHSAGTARQFGELSMAQFVDLALSPRSRELVILTTARNIECEYEWIQHEPISEAVGVTRAQRDALVKGQYDAEVFDDADRALVRFVAAIVAAPRIDDETFAAAREHLSNREIVEVLQVIGTYWTLGRVATVLDVELDPPSGTAVSDAFTRASRSES